MIKTSSQISFDPTPQLKAIAMRVKWAINDRNRNEMARIDDALLWSSPFETSLEDLSKWLVKRGLLTSSERTKALNLLPTF